MRCRASYNACPGSRRAVLRCTPPRCSTWRDTLSVLVARGRAQVGVHSAKTDWSRRILDFQYMDYDDQAAHQHA